MQTAFFLNFDGDLEELERHHSIESVPLQAMSDLFTSSVSNAWNVDCLRMEITKSYMHCNIYFSHAQITTQSQAPDNYIYN